jgi:hypothetical protein
VQLNSPTLQPVTLPPELAALLTRKLQFTMSPVGGAGRHMLQVLHRTSCAHEGHLRWVHAWLLLHHSNTAALQHQLSFVVHDLQLPQVSMLL